MNPTMPHIEPLLFVHRRTGKRSAVLIQQLRRGIYPGGPYECGANGGFPRLWRTLLAFSRSSSASKT